MFSKVLYNSQAAGPGLHLKKQVPRSRDTMLFFITDSPYNYEQI